MTAEPLQQEATATRTQSSKIREAKTERTKRTDKPKIKRIPLLIPDKTRGTNQTYSRPEQHYPLTRPDWSVQNTPRQQQNTHSPEVHREHLLRWPKIVRLKPKGIRVIQRMSFNRNEIKLEINKRKFPGKSPNIWKLNNILLNCPQIKKQKIKKEITILDSFKKDNTICETVLKQDLGRNL